MCDIYVKYISDVSLRCTLFGVTLNRPFGLAEHVNQNLPWLSTEIQKLHLQTLLPRQLGPTCLV